MIGTPADETIKWTDFDATLHNVAITSGPVKFSSRAFNKGGTYKVTFTSQAFTATSARFTRGL